VLQCHTTSELKWCHVKVKGLQRADSYSAVQEIPNILSLPHSHKPTRVLLHPVQPFAPISPICTAKFL